MTARSEQLNHYDWTGQMKDGSQSREEGPRREEHAGERAGRGSEAAGVSGQMRTPS